MSGRYDTAVYKAQIQSTTAVIKNKSTLFYKIAKLYKIIISL